jgi:transcription initiation factor IIF auxiliary subunit
MDEDLVVVKLVFGNSFLPVVNLADINEQPSMKVSNRWSMFLSIDNNKAITEKFINKVVYYLHPSYKVSRIEALDHPYLLSRTSFGTFIVGCEIHF